MVTNSDLPVVVEPIEAQNKTDLTIVVEPIEAQNNSDLPVVVESIEAQNKTDLPIVVEPIEAQNDRNENQIWFMNYGEDRQGLIISEHNVPAPYFTLTSALVNTFAHHKYANLIYI